MKKTLLAVLLFVCCYEVHAQRVKRFTAPLAGTTVLNEVEDKYNAVIYHLGSEEPEAETEQEELEEVKEQVHRRFPPITSRANKNTGTTGFTTITSPDFLPKVELGFKSDSLPGIPPDNDMAISKDGKAVSVINSFISVTDINAGQMVARKTLANFSKNVGINNNDPNNYRYDPKVIYDKDADKFIAIMLNATNSMNYIVVGFSKTNDPGGAWNFYKFYGDYLGDTTWFDFPSISMTKDEFFFTGNKIHFNTSWQAGFSQSVIYQLDKQSGYNGDTAIIYQVWDSIGYNGRNIRNFYPVKSSVETTGPEQYFLSNRNFDVQNDSIFLVKLPGNISSGKKDVTVTVIKAPLAYGVPPNGRQKKDTAELATNDGRILGAYEDNGQINFVSASVHPQNGASAVYHGIISNYKTNPQVSYAQFFTVDTLDFGYPNITYAGYGKYGTQSFISFNYSGPKTFPGLGVVLFDGKDYSALVKVKQGDSSIFINGIGKVQRWGDYMGAQPEYWNLTNAWIEGIFGLKTKGYGNWTARISSPLEQTSRPPQFPKTPNKLIYPNPAFQDIRFEFDVDKDQVYSFVIYNVAGQVVDRLLEQKCTAGGNIIQFNIAPLASGTYYLKAVNAGGKTDMSAKFVKY